MVLSRYLLNKSIALKAWLIVWCVFGLVKWDSYISVNASLEMLKQGWNFGHFE